MKSVRYKVDGIYTDCNRQTIVIKNPNHYFKKNEVGFLWYKDKGLKFKILDILNCSSDKEIWLVIEASDTILDYFGENQNKLFLEIF